MDDSIYENNLCMLADLINKSKEVLTEKKELEKKFHALEQENDKLKDNNIKLSQENSQLQLENHALQKNIPALEQENDKLKEENIKLKGDNTKLSQENSQLEQKKTALEAELNSLKNQFSAYYQYQKLPQKIQESYNQIIKSFSPMVFAVSGADKEHIKLFYEKICMEWINYTEEDLKILNQVFDYFFGMFQVNHPSYERIPVQTGEQFDSSLHRRTGNSEAFGTVKNIIIAGYHTKSHSDCMKSFVEIG